MIAKNDFCRTQNWYPVLGEYSAWTNFIYLSEPERKLLAEGAVKGKEVRQMMRRIQHVFSSNDYGYFFVGTDICSPTDTERFLAKRGAVHSAESAWFFLASSGKVRKAAAQNDVECLCIRQFHHIDRTREFRLFIYNGELKAASQYNLVRHFRRLDGIQKELWKALDGFFNKIANRLPEKNLVMDVFLDGEDKVNIIDVNHWGEPTDPLLLRSFDRDWSKVDGLFLMPPPVKISGNVAVSF